MVQEGTESIAESQTPPAVGILILLISQQIKQSSQQFIPGESKFNDIITYIHEIYRSIYLSIYLSSVIFCKRPYILFRFCHFSLYIVLVKTSLTPYVYLYKHSLAPSSAGTNNQLPKRHFPIYLIVGWLVGFGILVRFGISVRSGNKSPPPGRCGNGLCLSWVPDTVAENAKL